MVIVVMRIVVSSKVNQTNHNNYSEQMRGYIIFLKVKVDLTLDDFR